MKIRSYTDADAGPWDDLVGRSAFGTFLHSRRFLSYHGARLQDRSMLWEDATGALIGVFPAALKPGDPLCVASHPGATYGGLVCDGRTKPADVEDMLAGLVDRYRSEGLQRLEYRNVPPHLHSQYLQSDLHVLWKRGASIVRRDLWSVLGLRGRPDFAKGHKWAIARAEKSGVAIRTSADGETYRAFHAILGERLAERYGASPVHSVGEMLELRERFPGDIALWIAEDGAGRMLAGCWIFMFGSCAWHTQYIAATPSGRECCATHLLIDRLIREAERAGAAFFSLGPSTENSGRDLNSGLFAFKAGFRAGTLCQDVYQLPLGA